MVGVMFGGVDRLADRDLGLIERDDGARANAQRLMQRSTQHAHAARFGARDDARDLGGADIKRGNKTRARRHGPSPIDARPECVPHQVGLSRGDSSRITIAQLEYVPICESQVDNFDVPFEHPLVDD